MYQIDRFGGIENILRLVPAGDYVNYVSTYCHLTVKEFKSGAILSYVLSYVSLKDVLPIMRTCQLWYKATQSKTFWLRFIREAKSTTLKHIEHIQLFDTFCFPGEALREQVEWLWHLDWIYVGVYEKKNEYIIVRRTNMSSRKIEIVIHNGKIIRKCKLTKGLFEIWYFNQPQQWSNRINDENGVAIERNVIYQAENGAVFTGKGFKDANEDILPHGDGKWEFPDGTILEGKGVAWMGEPRKPLKRARTDTMISGN
jgi:hypothetical protein